MTDHHHDQHDDDQHDDTPAAPYPSGVAEWRAVRDAAADAGDLSGALLADNALEDRGALGTAGRRRTCRTCSGWADHVHDPLTGQPMHVPRWRAEHSQAHVTETAHIAARVFALAAAAPPAQWAEIAAGVHRITVELDTWHYEVILPISPAGLARPAYIDHYTIGSTGGLLLPFIYANDRATAAIANALRYLTRPART
ncbi:hypothetical protein J2W56_005503 [Nocardia kruczakiae]|uniref:Uncharacterized protein n=1 Tax=Nocardia kruczakiae TaxID=261477 RepID=A0ABU1XMF4_9NOCA|nr:hypothetical protein [Nocardia kruczakiae]MDR7171742.1 hypothetical protein [Nocardia kruczakiae]